MEFQFHGADNDWLQGYDFPCKNPRMVVQIAHGMTEHTGRYAKLAEFLNADGIAVTGFDLRGHGKNPSDPVCASLGEGGWEKSLEDMHCLYAETQMRYPDTPHAMLGFSLGSFLVREYLSRFENSAACAILLGTGKQPSAVLSILKAIIRTQIKETGFDRSTLLVKKLSFGAYNQKFAPNRTPSDWLCADEAELDAYRTDRLCCENISAGLFWQLLDSMQRTGNRRAYANWRKDFPVLLMSGAQDAVGDFGRGVRGVARDMEKAGLRQVEVMMIEGARHDVLHETARQKQVYGAISEFLRKALNKKQPQR